LLSPSAVPVVRFVRGMAFPVIQLRATLSQLVARYRMNRRKIVAFEAIDIKPER
jgi:hypothetical protein